MPKQPHHGAPLKARTSPYAQVGPQITAAHHTGAAASVDLTKENEGDAVMIGGIGNASPAEMPGSANPPNMDAFFNRDQSIVMREILHNNGTLTQLHTESRVTARDVINNMTPDQADTAMSRMTEIFDKPDCESLSSTATAQQIFHRNQALIHAITIVHNLSAATIQRFCDITFFQKAIFNAEFTMYAARSTLQNHR